MVGQGRLDPGMDEAVLLGVAGQDVQPRFDPTRPAVQRTDAEVANETGRGEALLDQLPVARMRLHRDAPQARCGVARANSASTSTPRGRVP
ncbi:Uncharacterised protein [Klebsiella pneumoniae]|nr:Uncharacterised protein [Klebsiella pneumoniae]